MRILLNEIMYNRKLSARQVAIATGLSKSTINRIANNQVSPDMNMMEKIAAGLQLKIEDLYDSQYKKCPR